MTMTRTQKQHLWSEALLLLHRTPLHLPLGTKARVEELLAINLELVVVVQAGSLDGPIKVVVLHISLFSSMMGTIISITNFLCQIRHVLIHLV